MSEQMPVLQPHSTPNEYPTCQPCHMPSSPIHPDTTEKSGPGEEEQGGQARAVMQMLTMPKQRESHTQASLASLLPETTDRPKLPIPESDLC